MFQLLLKKPLLISNRLHAVLKQVDTKKIVIDNPNYTISTIALNECDDDPDDEIEVENELI